MRLIIVSGLSGSGKSVALDMLEDLKYYCVDNIPAGLLPGFIEYTVRTSEATYQRTAVGVDVRNRPEDLAEVPSLVHALRNSGVGCELLFLRADNETLLKRFSETRRRHPLSRENIGLQEALEQEAAAAGAAGQRSRHHHRHVAALGARAARADPRTGRRAQGRRPRVAVPVLRIPSRRARRCGLRVRRAGAAEPVLEPAAARADGPRRRRGRVPGQPGGGRAASSATFATSSSAGCRRWCARIAATSRSPSAAPAASIARSTSPRSSPRISAGATARPSYGIAT